MDIQSATIDLEVATDLYNRAETAYLAACARESATADYWLNVMRDMQARRDAALAVLNTQVPAVQSEPWYGVKVNGRIICRATFRDLSDAMDHAAETAADLLQRCDYDGAFLQDYGSSFDRAFLHCVGIQVIHRVTVFSATT